MQEKTSPRGPLSDTERGRKKKPLILDEIQYAPELIGAIKRRIDADKTLGQFLLCGSQQWSVIKELADSLAGRVVFQDLDSLSIAEIAQSPADPWIIKWVRNPLQVPDRRIEMKYTLFEQLWRGFLPEAQFLPEGLLSAYFQSYERLKLKQNRILKKKTAGVFKRSGKPIPTFRTVPD